MKGVFLEYVELKGGAANLTYRVPASRGQKGRYVLLLKNAFIFFRCSAEDDF